MIPPQVILLGASNLTRGIATVIACIQRALGGCPCDFTIAYGHGRSFGIDSTILGRTLPGITTCPLWSAVRKTRHEDERVSFTLITDIGNDIMYEQPVDDIAAWVEACVDRLDEIRARIVITGLPIRRMACLSSRNYCAARRILFPRNRMTYKRAMYAARSLDEKISEIADAHPSVVLYEPDPEWYGIDPIHIRRRCWNDAWSSIMASWDLEDIKVLRNREPAVARSFRTWSAVRSARPREVRFFGKQCGGIQPSCRLCDGSLISLY